MEFRWGMEHICPDDVVFPSVAILSFDQMLNFYMAGVRSKGSCLQGIHYLPKGSELSNLGALNKRHEMRWF